VDEGVTVDKDTIDGGESVDGRESIAVSKPLH